MRTTPRGRKRPPASCTSGRSPSPEAETPRRGEAARSAGSIGAVAARLRAAGSVFAEDEAAILIEAASDSVDLESLVRRRVGGEPIEPLVGWVRFGRLRLAVGPGVFVPRQRSLRLARLAARRVRAQLSRVPHPVMVEPYAGVAPLAATVAASVPAARVHAADTDATALAFARSNLRPEDACHRSDGLAQLPVALRGAVGVFAAVPPYVPVSELALMPREARDFEPAAALVGGGPDGLDHARRLIAEAPAWIAPGGRVLIELHSAQLPIAASEARDVGWRARIHAPSNARSGVLELASGE